MENNLNSKQLQIIQTASKIFSQKGFKSTTMREIADNADVNLALLNYYFRSKENLFDIIMARSVDSMQSRIIPIFESNKSVKDKIEMFVDNYIDGVLENPELPGFIFHEIYYNPQKLLDKYFDKEQMNKLFEKFKKQLIEEAIQGKIKMILDPSEFLINIISLCAFQFIAKPFIMTITNLDTEHYNAMIRNRKTNLKQTILSLITKQ